MKNSILFILLFNSLSSLGQNHPSKSKLLNSGEIKIDSIQVQISYYEDRIVTESYFEKSKSKLSAVYIKTGKSFTKITTRENSSMPEDLWRTIEFDLENGKALNGKERLNFSGRMHGVSGILDSQKNFNKTLNLEFVGKYMAELFEKIKNYR